MDKQVQDIKPIYSFLPVEFKGLDSLAELALDMRWSWNHAADEVWQQLDPDLWNLTQNPWVVLQTVSKDQFQNVMSDPDFRKESRILLNNPKRMQIQFRPGFSKIIPSLHSHVWHISAWNSC